jgi:hypothetical protein
MIAMPDNSPAQCSFMIADFIRNLTDDINANNVLVMLTDLTPPQKELAEYMSSLSELAFCAGWMDGLEFALWRAATQALLTYGQLQLTQEQAQRLNDLSHRCGGRIFFHDDQQETFATAAEWQHMLQVRAKARDD